MSEKVDVSTLEAEREQLKKQLWQVLGAKTKLTDMLDKLDVFDKHYDHKYQDMQDNLYDKASELGDTIGDIDSQIGGAYEKQITAKKLYKILANFDKLYYRLTDLEKKEFLRDFIESVEIYPEKMDNGRMLKQINFNFPVYYDGEVGKEIRLLNENTVEWVRFEKIWYRRIWNSSNARGGVSNMGGKYIAALFYYNSIEISILLLIR